MKLKQNRMLSLAIIGSLFALSCMHSGKTQARDKARRKKSAMREMSNNAPKDIRSNEELNEHLEAGKPVVLMIHASWCGACKVTMPTYQQAASDNPSVTFLKVEGSRGDLAKKFKIRGFPTFVLFDAQGNEKHKFSGGGWPKSVLNEKIKKYIS